MGLIAVVFHTSSETYTVRPFFGPWAFVPILAFAPVVVALRRKGVSDGIALATILAVNVAYLFPLSAIVLSVGHDATIVDVLQTAFPLLSFVALCALWFVLKRRPRRDP